MISIKIKFHRRLKLAALGGDLRLYDDCLVISFSPLLSENKESVIFYNDIKSINISGTAFSFDLKNGEKIPSGSDYWFWITIDKRYVHFLKDYINAKINQNVEIEQKLLNAANVGEMDTYYMNDEQKKKYKRKKKALKILMIVLLVYFAIAIIVGIITNSI